MARYRSNSWRSFEPAATASVSVRRAAPKVARCRVLGLDPGSRQTGFGIIEVDGLNIRHVGHGCISVAGDEFSQRLRRIHERVTQIIAEFAPDEVAVERVFMSRNPDSALKLGQARGAAISAVAAHLTVFEYAPRAVKLATVGFGAAEKSQVSHMIGRILAIREPLSVDAADALAIAICHANARRMAQWVEAVS